MWRKPISFLVIITFVFTLIAPVIKVQAQPLLGLPEPGAMVSLSPAYQPAMIKGLTIHKNNPFEFDFLVDVGQDHLQGQALKEESQKLIKYFLASLAIPEKDFWVNLSPYEKDRTVPEALGQTDMGRDLLAQDYILKQITSSLIYPEKNLGRIFWDKVYAKAHALYGTTQMPINTFNKVWIVADKAEVFERNNTAFVVGSHLKVMLEEDYLALSKHQRQSASQGRNITPNVASNIVREIILPEIEKEVNKGKNFAALRQIFNSLILASWYKNNLKEALLNQAYSNKEKVKGIDLEDKTIKEQIYQRYLQAYKKGVFNYIKDDLSTDPTQTTPRKYFSGGMDAGVAAHPTVTSDIKKIDSAMTIMGEGRLEQMKVLLRTLWGTTKSVRDIIAQQTMITVHPVQVKIGGQKYTSGEVMDAILYIKESLKDVSHDGIVRQDFKYGLVNSLMSYISVRIGAEEQTSYNGYFWIIPKKKITELYRWLNSVMNKVLDVKRYEERMEDGRIRITPAYVSLKVGTWERPEIYNIEEEIDEVLKYIESHRDQDVTKSKGDFEVSHWYYSEFNRGPGAFIYALIKLMQQKGWGAKLDRRYKVTKSFIISMGPVKYTDISDHLMINPAHVNDLIDLLTNLREFISTPRTQPAVFDTKLGAFTVADGLPVSKARELFQEQVPSSQRGLRLITTETDKAMNTSKSEVDTKQNNTHLSFEEAVREAREKGLVQPTIVRTTSKNTAHSDGLVQGRPQVETALKAPGGIDLKATGANMIVRKEGKGVEFTIDPAMVREVKLHGINSLTFDILDITPVTSIWPLLGLASPPER